MPDALLVRGGRLVESDGISQEDLLLADGEIAARGRDLAHSQEASAASLEVLDVGGMLVFPGLIDPQVHFREPGLEHKEDLASGSLAAAAGGVTTFLEMPNTRPPTTNPERLADKVSRATGRSLVDFGFFLGASSENADRLGEWERLPGCPGVKVFMGSSTGNLLVPDDETLERVLRSGEKRVAVHSEDEPRLQERYAALTAGTLVSRHPDVRDVECAVRATKRLLDLVEKTARRVHILHLSTAEEVDLIAERDLGDLVTCEVTPNHLFLSAPECYETYGTLAQMNPPVRDERHQRALREALATGRIHCIGSDHAPHTLEEKARPYPESPSGIPGVQTILGLLLRAVDEGWLTLEDVARVTTSGPAAVWNLQDKGSLRIGACADLAIVDPAERGPLDDRWLRSRAGYSPYANWSLRGWPRMTILRGELIYRDHEVMGPPRGRVLAW